MLHIDRGASVRFGARAARLSAEKWGQSCLHGPGAKSRLGEPVLLRLRDLREWEPHRNDSEAGTAGARLAVSPLAT